MSKNNIIVENDELSEENDSSDSNYELNEVNEVNEINEIDENDNTEVENTEDYHIINEYGFIDNKNNEIVEYITGSDRISKNNITYFEAVRIIGERTTQLIKGAKPLIKNYVGLNYDEITIAEFKLKMCPFKIVRELPNGKFELWNFDELSQDYLKIIL